MTGDKDKDKYKDKKLGYDDNDTRSNAQAGLWKEILSAGMDGKDARGTEGMKSVGKGDLDKIFLKRIFDDKGDKGTDKDDPPRSI